MKFRKKRSASYVAFIILVAVAWAFLSDMAGIDPEVSATLGLLIGIIAGAAGFPLFDPVSFE